MPLNLLNLINIIKQRLTKQKVSFLGTSFLVTSLAYTIYVIVYYRHSVNTEISNTFSLSNVKLWLILLMLVISYISLVLFVPSVFFHISLLFLIPGYILKQCYRFMFLFHSSHSKFSDDPFFTWIFVKFTHVYSLDEKKSYILSLLQEKFPQIKISNEQIDLLINNASSMKSLNENFGVLVKKILEAENNININQDNVSSILNWLDAAVLTTTNFCYAHPYIVGGASAGLIIVGACVYCYYTGTFFTTMDAGIPIREALINMPTAITTTQEAIILNHNNHNFFVHTLLEGTFLAVIIGCKPGNLLDILWDSNINNCVFVINLKLHYAKLFNIVKDEKSGLNMHIIKDDLI